ncbi:ribonuclease Z [Antarcticibacterium sp. 1MA-6-2]|uniref:ribonuclease Z n=1 Tax=Antarcticibacterium sp. 1MA-6-2 TaxID=2908210 RepID=UPI001F27D92A|nr:ribonuclease Z [Antarcticibacterium sp. 1MA-6-2]UJH91497.1 ribonuclease Z [Antarcticibacterium sp. 1MA-6-2]
MKVIQKENYIIIEGNNDDLGGLATLISQEHKEIQKDNVVIDILAKEDLKEKDLLVFLEISNLHRLQKKSFVIAAREMSFDNIPEELIVVPSLREAEDIINMEELERELEH